jgi:threonine dehydratase
LNDGKALTPGLSEVRAAAALIKGAVERTPCLHSRTLSQLTGAKIWLKFENLQFTSSFKERGAVVKLSSLTPAERRQGVIAMSAGNHAQGVAYHAQRLGIPATIVMPRFTPNVKIKHTRAFGAEVLLHGESLADAAAYARVVAAEKNLVFVHPYDDERIIAGQGTIALEMLEDVPGLDVIVVPVGGGGLISGIALAAKALKPAISIIGVETELYPALHQRLHNQPVKVGGPTIAEGIAVRDIGERNLAIVRRCVDDVLVVRETDVERALFLLVEIEKTVVEGAGAAGLGAVLVNPERFKGRNVGLVLSGGNIDSRLLASILMRGLVRDGRLVRLRIDIPDAPGTLSRIAGLVGESGGNIVEVYHQRLFGVVSAKSADLDVLVETRDREHVADLLRLIAEAGYPVRLLDGPLPENGPAQSSDSTR